MQKLYKVKFLSRRPLVWTSLNPRLPKKSWRNLLVEKSAFVVKPVLCVTL